MKKDIKRKLLFIVIFIFLGIIFSQIFISPIVGAKDQAFTPFEFLGPASGMFLGSIPGALSVFFVRLFNLILSGQSLDFLSFMRLFPMALAAVYFGLTKSKKMHCLILLIPLLAIMLFLMHPEGQKAWIYSLYWLIPIFCYFKKDKLILNSLGSTFTAHAMGSIIFLYAFNLPSQVWLGLIPIVFIERLSFALGIWALYLCLNSLLNVLVSKKSLVFLTPLINQNYLFSKKAFKLNK